MKTLKVGDQVVWRGSWGQDLPQVARITHIEIVEEGQKEDGIPAQAVPWAIVEKNVVVSLDNGHWAYGYQIKPEVA